MAISKDTPQTPSKNYGWIVTAAGTAALLALGVLYAWSVFKANIPAEWGWADSQKSLPYSVACVVFSVMTMVGARLLGKYGPRVVVSLGGILAGGGVILSSLSTSPWFFTLAFGVLLGSGIGFVYASASPTALRWFPASKTGLISGIVVAGFGMGSAWVAPLARSLMETIGLQSTMLYMGIGMMVVVIGFAQLLKFPPADFVPDGNTTVKAAASEETNFSTGQTARTWQFYLIWLAFAFGSGAGLMVIGNLASIVKEQVGLPAISAIAVTALAFGNGGGRIVYGMLSDKFGRKAMLTTAFLTQALLVLVLSFTVQGSSLANVPMLIILVVLVGANYGANLAVFPAITKDYFGQKNFAMNYGIVYTAWGLGGFMLSQLAGAIKDATGSYTNAYFLSSGMLVIAAIMMVMLKSPQPKMKAVPAPAAAD
ncbi:MAG: OFA family MFS transporter [Anaerolineaceae bacterium]|nr:OFA family MFS transporter [Anaerolineaceae bacterium]